MTTTGTVVGLAIVVAGIVAFVVVVGGTVVAVMWVVDVATRPVEVDLLERPTRKAPIPTATTTRTAKATRSARRKP